MWRDTAMKVASGPASVRLRSIRNVFSNWGVFALSAAINLVLSPIVVHSLGDTLYGIWVLLGSLVGYLGLLDLGVRGAVTRYMAAYHAAGRHEEAGQIASAALWMFGAAGALAAALSGAAAVWGLRWFDVPAELMRPAQLALVVSGLSVAVAVVSGVFGGIVVGMQRFDALNAVTAVTAVARAVAVVLALRAGAGLVALAVIQLSVSTVQGLASALLSRRLYPELRLRLSGWGREHVRRILSYGIFASLLHVSASLINYSDSIVIGSFLPVAMITYFAIAASLTVYARQAVSGISYTTGPMAAALQGSQRPEAVTDSLMKGASFATLALLPIALTFLLRGETFIALWMGPEYALRSGPVLVALTLGLWPFAGFQICTTVLMGLNRHRPLVPLFAAEALCNVALSVALVGTYGVLGVAIGTLVPRLLISIIFGPLYTRGVLGISLLDYWAATLLRPALAMTPFAAASWGVETFWGAANLLVYFAQVGLVLPLALVGAWFVALPAADRRSYSRSLRNSLQSALGRSEAAR